QEGRGPGRGEALPGPRRQRRARGDQGRAGGGRRQPNPRRPRPRHGPHHAVAEAQGVRAVGLTDQKEATMRGDDLVREREAENPLSPSIPRTARKWTRSIPGGRTPSWMGWMRRTITDQLS